MSGGRVVRALPAAQAAIVYAGYEQQKYHREAILMKRLEDHMSSKAKKPAVSSFCKTRQRQGFRHRDGSQQGSCDKRQNAFGGAKASGGETCELQTDRNA